MLADGSHDIPPGKVVEVTTYLEMRRPPPERGGAMPEGCTIRHVTDPDPAWYRALFLRVGGADWLWFSRLRLSEAALGAAITDPGVEVYAVECQGRAEGLLELDSRDGESCELAYFGPHGPRPQPPVGVASLDDGRPSFGQGVGRALMNFAIERAFSRPITRFHVHTCQLDSPQALGFYRRAGFTPVRQSVEVSDDPRLTGDLPPEAGSHVPIFCP